MLPHPAHNLVVGTGSRRIERAQYHEHNACNLTGTATQQRAEQTAHKRERHRDTRLDNQSMGEESIPAVYNRAARRGIGKVQNAKEYQTGTPERQSIPKPV